FLKQQSAAPVPIPGACGVVQGAPAKRYCSPLRLSNGKEHSLAEEVVRPAFIFRDAYHPGRLPLLLGKSVLLGIPQETFATGGVADAERTQRFVVDPTTSHV